MTSLSHQNIVSQINTSAEEGSLSEKQQSFKDRFLRYSACYFLFISFIAIIKANILLFSVEFTGSLRFGC